jgi:hypothetical protein
MSTVGSPASPLRPKGRIRARESYEKFLKFWKDADPSVSAYRQAKAEYAQLRK